MITHDEYFTPPPPRDELMLALPEPRVQPFELRSGNISRSTTTTRRSSCSPRSCLYSSPKTTSRFRPKESELVFDVPSYFTSQTRWARQFKAQRCVIPHIKEIELTAACLTESERTPRHVVQFGYTLHGVPLTVSNPQPLPTPLPNAEHYQELSVPTVRFSTTAKTWAERKRTFEVWADVLNKCGLWERRDSCHRCGASFFKRKDCKLYCRDCGLKQFEPYFFGEFGPAWGENNNLSNATPAEVVALRETTRGGESRTKWIARVRMRSILAPTKHE